MRHLNRTTDTFILRDNALVYTRPSSSRKVEYRLYKALSHDYKNHLYRIDLTKNPILDFFYILRINKTMSVPFARLTASAYPLTLNRFISFWSFRYNARLLINERNLHGLNLNVGINLFPDFSINISKLEYEEEIKDLLIEDTQYYEMLPI